MTVTKTEMNAMGVAGGPFSPGSGTFTLTNTSGATLLWKATNTEAWTTLSPSSGALPAGGSVFVTCSINAAANTLPVGTYYDTITVTNITSGFSRQFTNNLSVQAFLVNTVWSSYGGGALGLVNAPRTFMGQAFTLDEASGTTNIPITKGIGYLTTSASGSTSYNNIRLNLTFWGAVSGAVSGATPAFSNKLGTYSFDTGPMTITAGATYPIPFNLPAPVLLPNKTGGITFSYQGDTGSGLATSESLFPLIHLQSQPSVGAPAAGTSPTFGYYQNISGETDANFLGSSFRFFNGQIGNCMAFLLQAGAGPAMSVYGNGASIFNGSNTASASRDSHFGSVNVTGGTSVRTFTILNAGPAPLILTSGIKVSISGAQASDFTVTSQPSSPIVGNNGSTTFQITFNPSATGTRNATVTIASNDTVNPNYTFAIQGTGDTTTPVITSSLTGNATGGFGYFYQITANNSPTSYNAVGLPAGLAINTETGLISGTPIISGTFNVFLNATNATGTGVAVLVLTIAPPNPVTLYDSYTGALSTLDTNTPHTFMGSPVSLGSAGGTTNINVAGGKAYLKALTTTSYTNIRLKLYFWGGISGATTGSTAAFVNFRTSCTFDLGPLDTVTNAVYPFTFTLPNPVTLPNQTAGVAICWEGDTGSGLATTENLTTAVRFNSNMAVGGFNIGTVGTYGFYRNVSGETDGNFRGDSWRWNPGMTNQALAFQLYGSQVLPMALTAAATNAVTTATLNATVNPAGAVTTAIFEYGTTSSYGSTVPITLGPSNGTVAQNVAANISGLVPNTTYHFRVKATNVSGTTFGRDLTFTTMGANRVVAVSSSLANGAYKAGTSVPVTVTFSEAVTVTGTPKIQLNSGADAFANYLGGSGTSVLTFNYVPAAGEESPDLDYVSATALVTNGGSIIDASGSVNLTLPAPGSEGSLGANKALVIDAIIPTVVVSPTGTVVPTSPIAFTLTFSEPVTGLASSGITVTNGTKGTLSGTGSSYTIIVTPTAQGVVTCRVNGGAASDAALNGNSISNTATVTYTFAPTVSVTPTGTATKNEPIAFALNFSQSVTGLTASGITVTNGTKGAITGSGASYSLLVTPSAQGAVTCQVNADAAQNFSSIGNVASNTASVLYDSVAPAVSVTPTGTATKGSPITFTITFSEPVTGFSSSSILVSNGTKGSLTGSGATYMLPVTPAGETLVSCLVTAGAASDAAGNPSVVSNAASVTFDTTAPSVSVMPTGGLPNSAPITFTITFSEAVTGFTASGISVTNATKGTLSGSGSVYTIPITPTGEGPFTCKVIAGAAQDAAGNSNTVSSTVQIIYDITPPTVSVTPSGTFAKNAPFVFSLSFSESVAGLTAAGVTVTNGTKGALTGSGANYSLQVTPTGEGLVTCQVNAGAARDPATNGNTVSNTASITFDTIAPTLVSAHLFSSNPDDTLAVVGDLITLNFTTSEAIQAPLVMLAGKSVTAANVSGNNWMAQIAVSDGTNEGSVGFSLSFSDFADNVGPVVNGTTDASAVTVDRTPPVVTAAHIASDNVGSSLAKLDNLISLTFTTSETVRTPIVSIAGQPAAIVKAGSNTWIATLIVDAGTIEGIAGIHVAVTDVAGNAGAILTAANDGSVVKIDRTPPALANIHLTSSNPTGFHAIAGDVLTLNFLTDEPIQTPAVSLTGAVPVITNPSGNNWTAKVTVTPDFVEGGVTVSLACTDLAGNQATVAVSTSDGSVVVVDVTAPTLKSVHLESSNSKSLYAKVGDTLTLTFISSESLRTPMVTLAGQAAALENTGGNGWKATRILTAGAPEGPAAIQVSYFDQAGNPGAVVTTTTDDSTVGVDTTPPSFTADPLARTVNPGASVTFTAVVTSLSPAAFQWRKNTVPIDGATAASFTLDAVQETDEGSFDCVVTNIVGSTTSQAAVLSVNDPIVITADLADKSANQGESAVLSLGLAGTQPITYQWRKNGSPIPGATEDRLMLSALLGDAGYYDVIVTNIVGSKTSAQAYFSVLGGMPKITRQPASRMVAPGAEVTFSVSVAGAAPFAYEWRKGGVKIAGSASAPYFTVAAVAAADAAVYSVKISNSAGSAVSDNATLAVKPLAYVFTTAAGAPGASGSANGTDKARFFRPNHIVCDSHGSFFITDRSNFVIRKMTADGTVSTFAGVAGNSGTADGIGDAARFTSVEGIAIDADDNLYVADVTAGTIRRITPAAEVTTFAGHFTSPATSTDGVGTAASFNEPRGIAVDAAGIIYISEGNGHVVRKISLDRMVSTLAGLAGASGTADGNGSLARFTRPAGLAVDAAGTVYVADEGNHAIRKITPAGEVSTVAGVKGTAGATDAKGVLAKFSGPMGIAVDESGVLFVTDTGNNTVRSISASGQVTTLGGLAGAAGSADGSGAVARFRSPRGITLDAAGVLCFADTENHTLRKGALVALPELVSQPQSLLLGIGQTATFHAPAAGAPPLAWQWLKKGVKIPAAESSAITADYTTPPVTLASAGTYSVVVSNSAGSVTSAGARLGVVDQADSDLAANEGTAFSMTVAAAGESLTYEWRKAGLPLANGGRVSGVSTAKLTVTGATLSDQGTYTCLVRLGSVALSSGGFRLGIRTKPVLAPFTPAPWISSGTVTDAVLAQDMSPLNRPTSYTVTGLPAGMTFDKTTGQLGGKPNAPGAYTLKITATNAAGSSAQQIVTLSVAALPEAAVGTFNGLVDRDATLSAPAATPPNMKLQGHGGNFYNLVITSGGAFTGTLNLEDKAYPMPPGSRLDAAVGADPTASVTLIRGKAGDAIADLSLTFSIGKDTGRLTGTISDGLPGSSPIPVYAVRNPWKTTATSLSPARPATALAGKYTAVLLLEPDLRGGATHPEIPQGHGFLTLTLTNAGIATWGGKLADGASVTGGATLGSEGEIPLHLMLYTPAAPATAGSVHGWTLASKDSSTIALNAGLPLLDGQISWGKLPQSSTSATRSYKSGFPIHHLIVAGGLYNPPPAKSPVLGLTDPGLGGSNAKLSFNEGGLGASALAAGGSPAGSPAGVLDQLLRITTANSTLVPTGLLNNPGVVTLTLSASSGVIGGNFTLKDTPPGFSLVTRSVSWTGILVPRLGQGFGQFQLSQLPTPATAPILSGSVSLEPAP